LIFVFVCQDMKRGVLNRVIAPGFKYKRKVKYHDLIIALKPSLSLSYKLEYFNLVLFR